MTTIAYRAGVLAADTVTCCGSTLDGHTTKIAKRGPYLAAHAGNSAMGGAFTDWFRSGMNGDPPPMKKGDEVATGVIFMLDDTALILNWTGWERRKVDAWSMGSGGDIALGAMLAGATPERAVEIAMTRDAYTSGEVRVLHRENS